MLPPTAMPRPRHRTRIRTWPAHSCRAPPPSAGGGGSCGAFTVTTAGW